MKISTLATLLCPATMLDFSGHDLAHSASQAFGADPSLDSTTPSVALFASHFATVWDQPRPIGGAVLIETIKTYTKSKNDVALRQTL